MGARIWNRLVRLDALACVLLAGLAGCSSAVPLPPPGPVATRIAVVDSGWHTDICLRREDAGERLAALAQSVDGVRFLCFGFGDRQYMVAHDHSLLTQLSSLLPSDAAIVLTPLGLPPAEAFAGQEVVGLGISAAGSAGLARFIDASIRSDAAGAPLRIGPGTVPGSVFFVATEDYGGFHTCNTWTGDALRSAGVPIAGAVLLSGDLMREVRRAAAGQDGGA